MHHLLHRQLQTLLQQYQTQQQAQPIHHQQQEVVGPSNTNITSSGAVPNLNNMQNNLTLQGAAQTVRALRPQGGGIVSSQISARSGLAAQLANLSPAAQQQLIHSHLLNLQRQQQQGQQRSYVPATTSSVGLGTTSAQSHCIPATAVSAAVQQPVNPTAGPLTVSAVSLSSEATPPAQVATEGGMPVLELSAPTLTSTTLPQSSSATQLLPPLATDANFQSTGIESETGTGGGFQHVPTEDPTHNSSKTMNSATDCAPSTVTLTTTANSDIKSTEVLEPLALDSLSFSPLPASGNVSPIPTPTSPCKTSSPVSTTIGDNNLPSTEPTAAEG